MSFKNHFTNSSEKISNLYEALFEASETYYNLTGEGLKQIFDQTFTTPPKVSKATNLIVLNPANEEDKKEILKYRKSTKPIRIVLYAMPHSRIVKPSIEADFYNISKEFLTSFPLIAGDASQKTLLATIDDREDKRKLAGKTSKDVSFKITDEEVLTFLDLLKNSAPTKFSRGVYYIFDTENEELYEIIYNKKDSKFAFDSLFTPSKPYEGPEEDGRADFKISRKARELADIQILGVYFDANEMMENILHFQKDNPEFKIPYEESSSFHSIVKPFEHALNSSKEFRRFNEIVKRDYKKFGYSDFIGICGMAGGFSKFVQEVVKISNPHIVFNSISEYKKLEAEKLGYKDEDVNKSSTVDALISTVDAEELFALISRKDSKLLSEDSYVKVVDEAGKTLAKYWQVNLKESVETPMGRSQRYFSKIYSMIVNAKEVFESYQNYEELLNESILEKLTDAAKKGAKFLKEVGKKLFDKIKYLILALKDWSVNVRENISKNVSGNVVEYALELFGKGLQEDVKKEVSEIVEEVLKGGKTNWKVANDKIERLVDILEKSKNKDLIVINFEDAEEPTSFNVNLFKRLIFNYSFLKAFQGVVANSKNPLEKYIDELLGLYVEAVYGATKLPVWKVYAVFGGHKPYEFLGTRETDKESRKESILKNLGKEGVPLVVLDLVPNRGAHGITINLLSDLINESGKFTPKYTVFEVSYVKETLVPSFQALREIEAPFQKD
jgi:hypothetical protein